MKIQLLAGFLVCIDGAPVAIPARKDRWLLALLALGNGKTLRRADLQDALWPRGDAGDPAYNLRRSLANLRKALPGHAHRIESPHHGTVRFALDAGVLVDALAFDAAVASSDPMRWREAVERYAGPLLPECGDLWTLAPRQERHRLYLDRVTRLAESGADDAPELLRHALSLDPLWEEGVRLRMQALFAAGQLHDALQAFHDFERRLRRDDPRLAPHPDTVALAGQIRARAGRPAAHTAAPSAPPPSNLPNPVNRFIGREPEIARGVELLGQTRLLTLTGAGGCGKTRLSQEVAQAVREDFPDGVWWVELAPIAEPELVAQTVATLLQVRDAPGEPILTTLVSRLKSKRLLLVLDNCEHLLYDAAALADTLLRACPGVKVLTTSREALNVAGETAYRIPSLTVPPEDFHGPSDALLSFEAAQLFVERAVAAKPEIVFPGAHTAMVASICRRLDGIPLAIELAAARVRSMTLAELDRRLDDRFSVLTGGSPVAPHRHQTLRALIDWSYQLLTPDEQALLRRLSVFAGGWTLEAAEAVCTGEGSVLDGLMSLVDKNLVVTESFFETTRFHFLETVRQFGRERLDGAGETYAIRRRHLDYFLNYWQDSFRRIPHPTRPLVDIQKREHDNSRAALDFCEANPSLAETHLRLVRALWGTWVGHGCYAEYRNRALTALATYGAENRTPLRAHALLDTAFTVLNSGAPHPALGHDYCRVLGEEALSIFLELRDEAGIVKARESVGMCSIFLGDYARSQECFEMALAYHRDRGNTSGMLNIYHMLTYMHFQLADFAEVRRLCREANILNPTFGESREVLVLREEGRFAAARPKLEEAVRQIREVGHRDVTAQFEHDLALLLHGQGDLAGALDLFRSSLRSFWEMSNMGSAERSLQGMAALAWDLGRGVDAPRLWGAAEAMRERYGLEWFPLFRIRFERQSPPAIASLGEEAFAAAWEEGRSMALDDVVALALSAPALSG